MTTMFTSVYKQWYLVFVLMAASLYGVAQQHHFVYIQADNQQPFYVKYGGKNYSSSAIGYLILPKLSDGNISLQIGFPKNLYPEQNFNVSIAGKDLGFALKNFNEKGWGLFNFQTTDIVMNGNAATNATSEASTKTTTNNGNAFGNMLASAINDSTLNQQRVVPVDSAAKTNAQTSLNVLKDSTKTNVEKPISTDTTKTTTEVTKPVKDTPSAALQTQSQTNNSPANLTKSLADSTNPITKSSEKTNENGTDLTFLDNAGKDTIHAFIPSSNQTKNETKITNSDSTKKDVSNPFFNSATPSNSNNNTTVDSSKNESGTNGLQVKSSCTKMFTSYEADKLKKKIISLTDQGDILNAVRKSLRDKCISTDQVKDLGNLFLSDDNRYGFYDTVYPFVYDYGNYGQLQNTLIDTYYKNRFKALLR